MVGTFWPQSWGENGTVCKAAGVYEQIMIVIIQIIGGVIMIIRVYALYQKSRRVVLFLISLALAVIGVGCWAVLSPSSDTSPAVPAPALRYGCNVPITYDQAEHMAIAWGGQMMFDAVVFVLTLWRTLRIGRLGHRTLLDVLIRDGVLYFGLMTSANVANITAFLVATTSPTKSLLAGFTNVISSTMISRLMLNLRDPKILMYSQPATPMDHSSNFCSYYDSPMLLTTVMEAEWSCSCPHTSRPCHPVGGCVGYHGDEPVGGCHNAAGVEPGIELQQRLKGIAMTHTS
ncbi:hypothetical protein BKA82DRAFT_1003370 [Pisolithus tinctorius]|uniref:Uncharacterized protein n=1 Tax=Pisolithus tinctorius Marx 270 TaxID=870435 RepID=A0A0C3JUF3_PISTI|nr:hypothetical protein BKA82DRAFT_1003370 [Pisolithus tinctorius]KIO01087.1 hypothetical protein M404DRAFT_1003370 [Pisolithus tinctorius Marx 270]